MSDSTSKPAREPASAKPKPKHSTRANEDGTFSVIATATGKPVGKPYPNRSAARRAISALDPETMPAYAQPKPKDDAVRDGSGQVHHTFSKPAPRKRSARKATPAK